MFIIDAKSVFVLLLLVVNVLSLFGEVTLQENVQVGDRLQAVGWELLPSSDLYETKTVMSTCACRISCYVDSSCNGVSYENTDNGVLCSKTNLESDQFDITNTGRNLNSVLLHKGGGFINPHFSTRSDGLVYGVFDAYGKTFENAERFCDDLPGFQLPVFTESNQIALARSLTDHHGKFWINLSKNDADEIIFANGKTWEESALYSEFSLEFVNNNAELCFAIEYNKITELNCNSDKYKVICQSIF